MVWKVRNSDDHSVLINDSSTTCGADNELFTIKLHHSGKFVMKDKLVYDEGKVSYIDDCSKDEMSLIELAYMAGDLGIYENLDFYYSCDGVDKCSSLVHITSDMDTLNLFKYSGEAKMVGVFVDHYMVDLSNLEVDTLLPRVDEPLSYIGFCEEDSCESEGEVSIGEDSEHSDLMYDSDGQYYDEDYKLDEADNANIDAMLSQSRGKKPWEVSENEKFSTYLGPGTHDYQGYTVFNPKTDMAKVELRREMCFTDRKIFRDAVRKHAVDNCRSLEFPTNNTNKIQVKCADKSCPFYVFASKVPNNNTFQIKVIHFEHECIRQKKTVQGDTRFLTQKYGEKLRNNPTWKVDAMLKETRKECNVEWSTQQMYRTKYKIKKMDKGDGSQQFCLLRAYGDEILRSNPGSTFKLQVKTVGDKSYFKRVYVCWNALKCGMLDGCRKVILLDGCHIRTEYGGIILTAIGLDANNSMYPFAYAVVEKEKMKSWSWFLELVKKDLNITDCEEWTFMSDKQKGLVKAISEKFPGSEHRCCVMHLYSNFKLKHKGLTLKNLLWKAARATREVDYEKAMEELRDADVNAHAWLLKRPPQNWSKAFFNTSCKSDILLNNLSESFNGAITKMRMLPILWMMESIRFKLMKTIGMKVQKMMRYRGTICPRIAAMFEKNMIMSTEFTAIWNGHEEFNVQRTAFGSSYRVHLSERFCSCRRWQLTGIPCAHAICGMHFMNYKAEKYIDGFYSKETYMRIYSHCLLPIASQEEWPVQSKDLLEIFPPVIEKQPGRPKEYKRKKQAGEKNGKIIQPSDDKKFGKMSKKGGEQTCSACTKTGHNKRICPTKKTTGDEQVTDNQKPTKKRKKDVVDSSVNVVANSSKKVEKLQVRRNAENWMDCSSGGAKLARTEHVVSSQLNTSSFKSSQAITNGFSLSQPSGNYSRHLGNASFATKPSGSKKV